MKLVLRAGAVLPLTLMLAVVLVSCGNSNDAATSEPATSTTVAVTTTTNPLVSYRKQVIALATMAANIDVNTRDFEVATAGYQEFASRLAEVEPPSQVAFKHQAAVNLFTRYADMRAAYADAFEAEDVRFSAWKHLESATGLGFLDLAGQR